ncbi:IS1182 family transposase [Kandleria vitulina]|uniref:IS1182 family transposase n=1 Tax=Kandleria vitulina TaxID=1630 RepID=UPI00332FB0A8
MARNRISRQCTMLTGTLEDYIPHDHLLRKLDRYVDWSFIYEICDDLYDTRGRNRIDPVVLFKMMFINIIFGFHSMRRTCNEIEISFGYRWFLGLGMDDKVPDHSTFSQNYRRKFKDNDVAIRIFGAVIAQLLDNGLVDSSTLFIDGTHIKACANKNKSRNRKVEIAARRCKEELDAEIDRDREEHGKKPFDRKEEAVAEKEIKTSTTDPECGYFHKGEKEKCFAYNANVACDRNAYILGMSIEPGNVHDSTAVYGLYDYLDSTPYARDIEKIVADAGYSNPELAHYTKGKNMQLIAPKKRSRARGKGKYGKHSFEYDREAKVYVCPQGCLLEYSTTNRSGRQQFRSNKKQCESCPKRQTHCTESKTGFKMLERHLWQDDLDEAISLRRGDERDTYAKRKQTIERAFGDAKMAHGLDYTRYRGLQRVTDIIALTFAGMNIKKMCTYLARLEEKCAQKQNFEHQSDEVKKLVGVL